MPFNSFIDLLSKYEYDFQRYKSENTVYCLLDCIFTLNAIPDWIKSTTKTSNPELYSFTDEKSKVFSKKFPFNAGEIESDVDQQIKLIRMICNHSKHNNSRDIPIIIEKYGTTFPMRLPARFQNCVFIGDKDYDAEYLITSVYNFWKETINRFSFP